MFITSHQLFSDLSSEFKALGCRGSIVKRNGTSVKVSG